MEGQRAAETFEKRRRGNAAAKDGFVKVLNLKDFGDRRIKAVPIDDKKFAIVINIGSMIFCCKSESTAYKFLLVDGELFSGPSGAAIRSPFDGSSYDLATGDVIEWGPQDTLPRKLLGKLKEKTTPMPLRVYPVEVNKEGDIFAALD